MTNIQNILIPTVPITDNIIGTSEYPIPRSAPGNRSIIPHKKYGTVVIDNISIPHLITSSLLVYIISTLSPNIYARLLPLYKSVIFPLRKNTPRILKQVLLPPIKSYSRSVRGPFVYTFQHQNSDL